MKELRPDQIDDLAALIANPKMAVLHDPAVGKTPTVCAFTQYCWEYKGLAAAWTQPVALMKKNRDEMLDCTNFKPEDLVLVQGPPKVRQKLMKGPGKVFFFSADGFANEWEDLKWYHPELGLVVCDELHLYFRGHTARRTQNWYRACRAMKAVVPVTGSLLRGKLSSAYPTIHVLAPHIYGSYEAFMAQHALVDEYGNTYGWTNHEKLSQVLKQISIRRTFESVHGVEKPFINVIKCQMNPTQRDKYKDWHELGLIELSDQFMESKGGGASWIRALQIMAHPESVRLPTRWDEDGKPIAWKVYNLIGKTEKNGKDEILKMYIQDHLESGDPLVIYAALIPEQLRIRNLIQEMGGKVGLVNSTVLGPQRQQIDIDFRNGALQFVVGSPATCSTGFNWQDVAGKELGRILFSSMSPDDTDFTQAYKRGIRRKRTTPLEVVVLEYEDSLDQRIFQIIETKSKEANKVDETNAEVKIANSPMPETNTGRKLSMAAMAKKPKSSRGVCNGI